MDSEYTPRNANAPNSMPSVANAAAPEETPSKNGSARLLRTSACIATPHTASDAPTTMPRHTRGRRSPITMFQSSCSQLCGISLPTPGIRLSRIFSVLIGATETGPKPVASTIVTAAITISIPIIRGILGSVRLKCFFRLFIRCFPRFDFICAPLERRPSASFQRILL